MTGCKFAGAKDFAMDLCTGGQASVLYRAHGSTPQKGDFFHIASKPAKNPADDHTGIIVEEPNFGVTEWSLGTVEAGPGVS